MDKKIQKGKTMIIKTYMGKKVKIFLASGQILAGTVKEESVQSLIIENATVLSEAQKTKHGKLEVNFHFVAAIGEIGS